MYNYPNIYHVCVLYLWCMSALFTTRLTWKYCVFLDMLCGGMQYVLRGPEGLGIVPKIVASVNPHLYTCESHVVGSVYNVTNITLWLIQVRVKCHNYHLGKLG